MKYKKFCKRITAFLLCTTILAQTAFNAHVTAFAGQSATTIDNFYNLVCEIENENSSDEEIYDETGVKLVPLSSEALRISELNAKYDNLNPIISNADETSQQRATTTISLSMLIGAITVGLLGGVIIWGISKKATDTLRTYWVNYAYPSHSKSFTNVKFSFTDSDGLIRTETITQQMMENLGKKLEAYEAGRIWEVVFLLTEEDKLCLTYTMYKHGYLTNLKRENIKISKPADEIIEEYPYYIMVGNDSTVSQICFDKNQLVQ